VPVTTKFPSVCIVAQTSFPQIGWIIAVTVVVCVTFPFVPLMIKGKFPVGAPGAAEIVMVEELPVTALGLKLTLTPFGREPGLRKTVPVKPPERVIVNTVEALLPLVTANDDGLGDS
jgi:hypothetical protein